MHTIHYITCLDVSLRNTANMTSYGNLKSYYRSNPSYILHFTFYVHLVVQLTLGDDNNTLFSD